MAGALAQTTPLAPALTIGAGVNVMMRVSLAGVQLPLPVVVSVSVTWPPAMSPAPGTYVAFNVLVFGVNVPVPPLHTPPVAVTTLPPSETEALFPHTVTSGPALAVG